MATPKAPLTGSEIRSAFLSFFEQRGHRPVRSSALVPANDPTLLFTNAGMVQFKDVFTGREKRDYNRATTSQKCVRAGGKHNDLENVGYTARHHTFFEMLGNFSFGDYFKRDAIAYAWELLTSVLAIPVDRLAVTVFEGTPEIPADTEAEDIWREVAGVAPDRIIRLGLKDNFWMMGETGPCGPCSEIHFFQGADVPCQEEAAGRPCQGVACDCDRWMEIWNLVFMQFERDAQGKMSALPRPSIDTGAGLERLAAVLQGKRTNYDTDLLQAIISAVGRVAGKTYDTAPESEKTSMRVVADHARAAAFLVADGVLPSNEGRGYVLRRIMRRAIRHGTTLGLDKLFFHEVCAAVIAEMHAAYPELRDGEKLILEVARNEESGFRRTLSRGLQLIGEEIESRKGGDRLLPGDVVFKLYDTYGFPVDLTRIIAEEHGFFIDEKGFEAHLEAQRERSTFAGSGEAAVGALYLGLATELGETSFVGYEALETRGKILAILKGGQRVSSATAGDEVEVILDRTSFYGESGGQVGDEGALAGPGIDGSRGELRIEIRDTQKPAGNLIVHLGKVVSGLVHVGEEVDALVDGERRRAIKANHSATHLLHRVLKDVLGEHVKQAGSVVAPDHMRFDYTHFQAPSPEQLEDVEERVNRMIRDDAAATTQLLSLDEARASGAVALFGEKYGETVRVIQVHPASRELCGGTHTTRTGEIGFFKVTSEASIAAGVRRIVAVTGEGALRWVQERDRDLRAAAGLLRAAPGELASKIDAAQKRMRDLEKELDAARKKLAAAKSGDLLAQAREIRGVKVLVTRAEGDAQALRELADKLRDKLGSGIIALGGESDGKAVLLVAATPDVVAKGIKAGDLVREMAKEVGGKGGGKPDLAQAGGPDPSKLDQALAKLDELLP
ncbi:alanine--tRNA ligase [Vulgatibacter incomptus]|uniref:Alanine--tRNA ligase n=1 Tax=Vulgatibacter incomptus TaxID=1391653 RepID=A0A0K1PAT1_9BACT|nr:alanine--tRNA ligase [Vulgatibacter incomptus]AKU90204.1 Alanyl-tRNA synthetase [Vulgatibacter incomptus]